MMALQSVRNLTCLASLTSPKVGLYQQIMQKRILAPNVGTVANIAIQHIQCRPFFLHWVNSVFNKVSQDRIKEVGPDRACAEWLMRNGALVQWAGAKDFVMDYNELPLDCKEKGQYFIKAVDATESSIMAMGFPHFDGCNHIEKILFKKCSYLQDDALPLLSVLKNSLKTLEIIYCWNLTAEGLLSLGSLSNLKTLRLEGLSDVKKKMEVEQKLKQALPSCDITFDEKT